MREGPRTAELRTCPLLSSLVHFTPGESKAQVGHQRGAGAPQAGQTDPQTLTESGLDFATSRSFWVFESGPGTLWPLRSVPTTLPRQDPPFPTHSPHPLHIVIKTLFTRHIKTSETGFI